MIIKNRYTRFRKRKDISLERLGTMLLFTLLGGMLMVMAALTVAGTAGCGSPHVPWNRGTSWNLGASESKTETPVRQESVPQKPIENFCEDNREDIARYETYLSEDYRWPGVPKARIESRESSIQNLVNQYERLCE